MLAQKGPESLLPPGFESPEPTQAAPSRSTGGDEARPDAARPSGGSAASAPSGGATQTPTASGGASASSGGGGSAAISDDELISSIDPALMKQLVDASKPRYDIPPADQRSLAVVGALAEEDGGLPPLSTVNLNGEYVGALLSRMSGPLVSRWGQILLRRALTSRLATPVGMNGADWAAARAQVLLRMGEADAARLLVSQVDNADYTSGLEDAAMDSFLATADPIGLCPITQLTAAARPGWQWELTRAVCGTFTRSDPGAGNRLDRSIGREGTERIDVLLAQKFAGVGAARKRAVKIEWDGVDNLTAWRFGYALATGVEPPRALIDKSPQYWLFAARAPMLPLVTRAAAADHAAARGVLSATAAVDLYSDLYGEADPGDPATKLSGQLREAYVAKTAADRVSAVKGVWGDGKDADTAWSRHVLTAYAAARITPSDVFADDAPGLIASMLTAGLDANAMLWAGHVARGSEGWGLLALAAPNWNGSSSGDGLSQFYSGDKSKDSRKSAFLLAGLMGLGRLSDGDAQGFAGKLGVNMAKSSRWTRAIDSAAASGNPALVALLAGFGMQGAGWDKMTAVHLFHIVGALHRVGLDGEARMIAAEAVARA